MVNHGKLGAAAGIPAAAHDVPLARDAPKTRREFAEPAHRLAPESVGSGISFRRLPRCDFDQVRKMCQFYESKAAGHYDARSARYLYDLSREVQASLRAIETDTRASEAQHTKVLEMFEQWNDVLVTAKARFGVKAVLTPHMLLGMVDSSHKQIAELQESLGDLQSRHEKFEATIASSVDSQTVAVRTHYRQELEATASVHRKSVEQLHDQAAAHVESQANEMARGVSLAYHAMEREKCELVQSYSEHLEQSARKLHATTVECNAALEQMRLEQQKQREVYALQVESVLAASTRRHQEELDAVKRQASQQLQEREVALQEMRVAVASRGEGMPAGLVALLASVSESGKDASDAKERTARMAAEERARSGETHAAQLSEQIEQLRRRVAMQDRLLAVHDASLEEGVTLRREKAFLLGQLEQAQSAIDVAEGRVDANAGAALARESGTLRVNPASPFVVSAQAE